MDFIKSKEENNNNLIKSKNNKKYIPFPTKCCICGYICSGYIYYNVICCDGCKHFFRRCVNAKELYKCKNYGNCNVMNVAIKCKSCRFDKCILVGMVFQSIRGLKSKSLSEINTIIKQRRNELKAKGKFYENGVVVTINEINNVSDMPSSLFISQVNEIINFLTLVEKNAQLIRNSPKRVPNWHYNSFNSFETLITRKENIIASSHEYLYQQQNFLPLEVIEYIRKNGFFTMPPSSLMEDLLLIVDIGKTMPFFDHLDLSEKVNIF
uniref:Nuclear receptor domain-containing protein n=2 Tax=Meloidogyne hapla TaxID=6305 RepID=A0A1I8BZX3_MELHA